ncbi:MAG: F5/8 type C domain protein [candidate division BRC1 bacterium ADurb.BinA364]|nr:MAG: F5/8 type C domain protein [candidate division BRC1 bacterium ADurb.BinA364]
MFAGLFEAASEGNQAALLHALAARNDPAMLPAFLKGLQAKEAAARIAAVQALEFCADASMVVPLASMAASADPAEQSAARQALERVSFQNADQAILAAIDGAAPAVRLELIRVLGVRRAEEGLPLLRAACLWEDAAIRLQAIKSLGELGGESEAAVLIEAMLSAANAEERDAAGVALAAVCRRIEPANRRAAPILGALAIHTDAPSRQSLLSALGRIGAGEGLGALRQAAQTGDMDTRKIAVRALADWPGAAPLFTLMDIAKKSDDTVLRVLALRGCAAQLAMPGAMPPDAKADLYAAAIGLLDSAEEIVRFLPGLGAVRSARALALAEELMKNPDLKQEATLARNSIRKLLDAAIDVSASVNSDKAALAIDGKRETRWTTGASQAPGQWFQIDLKEPRAIEALALDAGDQGNDSPAQYEVYVFLDKAAIGKPAASGQSKGKTLAIPLAGAEGRFILIKQMGALKNYWSIAELKIEFSQK